MESRISEEERKKNDILHDLLRKYIDENNAAEIAEMVADESPEYAARMLMAAYTKTGNLVQAQSLLDAMPIMDTNDQEFKDIQTINIQRAADPQFSLSAAQEATIRAVANDYLSPILAMPKR